MPEATAAAISRSVGAFVHELVASGVRHVALCPGSRSTPLAILLARQPALKLWLHLDERSAAYFGLGLARALRQPVALLATSGTAAANFLPAVVEASLARVPLVVLTADRPHELRDCGAPQTMDQQHLYGAHAKWFFDLPEPSTSEEVVGLARTVAARAVSTALAEPAGPVHVNWPLREPLLPEPVAGVAGQEAAGPPHVAVSTGRLAPAPELVQDLAAELSRHERGLLICGPQDDPALPAAVVALAERLGYPVLADPLSGVRCGAHDRWMVLDAYDAVLRVASVTERLQPSIVLRLGALPTSKPVVEYLQRCSGLRQVVVDPGGWREPTGLASDLLHVDPLLLCQALSQASPPPKSPHSAWLTEWLALDRRARQTLDDLLWQDDELSEPGAVLRLASLLPPHATVFAGNSMPVRDLESFVPSSSHAWRFLSNRGANGIDGVVSSALGASAAGQPGPVVLVIGDISLYHDLNGLLAARRHGLDLLVVLLNNDGGGIFSFLPQAGSGLSHAEFELLFGTPHGLDFRPFIEGYGGRLMRVSDWPGFTQAVEAGLGQGGLQVVEVPTQRPRNVEVHRRLWQAVSQALSLAAIA